MTYHISDLKQYTRCPRYWLLNRQNSTVYQPYIRLDETVTDLAIQKLGISGYFLGVRGDPPERARAAMKEYDWLVKARFEADGLRIKVPFLHRVREGWDLYFLFIGLYPHQDDMQFYCDTVWVLRKNGFALRNIRIIHLNADYVRGRNLDLQQLFVISDHFYNAANHPSQEVGKAIQSGLKNLHPLLEEMRQAEQQPLPDPVRIPACSRRTRCRFFSRCFPELEQLPDNSILTLSACAARERLDQAGRHYLRQATGEDIEGSGLQYAQIMADRSGGLFVDQAALKSFLRQFRYPISFLDFEWERYAIPPYEGMKPYDVLLFEYSLHVLQADGTVSHHSFLSVHDDRRALAEDLLASLPDTGSICAYNADGAEKIRIEELAGLFPDLAGPLRALNRRMIDMQVPFIYGLVYDVRMRGSWTLKSIMAFQNDRGYRDLDIQQGLDAVFRWRILDRNEDSDHARQIREELKKYCSMDTYALLVVYRWLRGLV